MREKDPKCLPLAFVTQVWLLLHRKVYTYHTQTHTNSQSRHHSAQTLLCASLGEGWCERGHFSLGDIPQCRRKQWPRAFSRLPPAFGPATSLTSALTSSWSVEKVPRDLSPRDTPVTLLLVAKLQSMQQRCLLGHGANFQGTQ